MASISYSPFLQALGWAALNSLWQAGLLWLLYLVVNYLGKLSPQKSYMLSVAGICASFILFCGNIFYFLFYGANIHLNFIDLDQPIFNNWLTPILTSASIAYLVLLLIPIHRLWDNWQYLRLLQTNKLQKTCIDYKLFVQKMSHLLGIKRQVSIYISEFIQSPVTIGFLKPIILLPVASLNNLTLQQAEAVLLHELSHIRRYDYLVNVFISVIHTVLYFNPFVKLFVTTAEHKREESCDQVVLQFGYDKVGYATALLNLEKASAQSRLLAIGATGKSNFVQRIEKIVGLSSSRYELKFSHIAGFMATLIIAFFMHAFFTVIQQKQEGKLFAFNNFANPFYFLVYEEQSEENSPAQPLAKKADLKKIIAKECTDTEALHETKDIYIPDYNKINNNVIPVALNEVEASLTEEQKNKIKTTINLAKEVLITYEWGKLKESVPDGLTKKELEIARKEYLREVNKVNWNNLEENLKAGFDNINWEKLNENFEMVLNLENNDSCLTHNNHELVTPPLPPTEPECAENLQYRVIQKCEQVDTIHQVNQVKHKKVVKL
jgi:bla regulator protein blaR1